eukprot:19419_1
MAVQVMYHNQSVHTHPSFQTQQLKQSPNSSINGQTLSHSFNEKSNLSQSFSPFKPHQQQQQHLVFGNIQPKANIPLKSSTISLAEFACDIEKEITNKVLKKLKLNQNNHNNILMVTMCKLVDNITENINDNMMNLRNEFKESFNILSEQL